MIPKVTVIFLNTDLKQKPTEYKKRKINKEEATS
jgi:hypothetical protein